MPFIKITNLEELEHMEYICDEIIHVTKYEQLHIFQIEVEGRNFLLNFFVVNDIHTH
jgi:hypothetical protein